MARIPARILTLLTVAAGTLSATLIDFESPPGGLVPAALGQGAAVPANSQITNQYQNLGVLFSSFGGAPFVALLNLGSQATSGSNGVSPAATGATEDFGGTLDFIFVVPATNTPGVTNQVSIRGDNFPGSGNFLLFSVYDVNGVQITSGTQADTAGGTYSLSAAGIHEFRIQSQQANVVYDDLSFNTPVAAATGSAPEPGTFGVMALMLAAGIARRRLQRVG